MDGIRFPIWTFYSDAGRVSRKLRLAQHAVSRRHRREKETVAEAKPSLTLLPVGVGKPATGGTVASLINCRYTETASLEQGQGNAMNAETKTKIVVLTGNYRITGSIDLLPGARLTDFLLECREFMAITDAEVWDLNGRRLFASSFMNINRDHIEMVMPEDTATKGLGRPAA